MKLKINIKGQTSKQHGHPNRIITGLSSMEPQIGQASSKAAPSLRHRLSKLGVGVQTRATMEIRPQTNRLATHSLIQEVQPPTRIGSRASNRNSNSSMGALHQNLWHRARKGRPAALRINRALTKASQLNWEEDGRRTTRALRSRVALRCRVVRGLQETACQAADMLLDRFPGPALGRLQATHQAKRLLASPATWSVRQNRSSSASRS
mmetsp:Transcript_34212/g.43172  ORF Transcript_34212/g.43172 Transcript_34212/m.43172 type:complete len:208 (-) Transcript_34212:161-784(-)